MPRPKKPGGPEPKKRSRNGCWPCKARKIKCGEERPTCSSCERQGQTCDYSLRLNWEGRSKKKKGETTPEPGQIEFSSIKSEAATLSPGTDDSSGIGGDLGMNDYVGHNPFQRSYSDGQVPRSVNRDSAEPQIADGQPKRQVMKFKETRVPLTLSSEPSTSIHVHKPASLPVLGRESNSAWGVPGTGSRDPFSTAQLSRIREQANAYPSPADSVVDGPPRSDINRPGYTNHNHSAPASNMPPPFYTAVSSPSYFTQHRRPPEEVDTFGEHRSKKMRLSPSADVYPGFQRNGNVLNGNSQWPPFKSTIGQINLQSSNPRSHSPSTGGGFASTPATSVTSDDTYGRYISRSSPQPVQESPDLRRLSVKSLLSDDSPIEPTAEDVLPMVPFLSKSNEGDVYYGLDCGFRDLDLPGNNDSLALNGITPSLGPASYAGSQAEDNDDFVEPIEFGFGLYGVDYAQEQGGYYAKPVAVSIPKSLGILPSTLQDNPMNLLYFHHFINHTARILVIHDCSENPFRSILPQMAITDAHLLHLLLAYSASHRARLLHHPEPANRIALWVQDVFPTLRHALDSPSPHTHISNSNLASAIMLASLEIISPNTFEVPVPWQHHLNVARRMILARGGAQSVHRKDKVSYFLTRWFAYLDVLGSLSGGKNDQPLFHGNYWASDHPSDPSAADEEFQIDCLLGFTSHCVGILAKIAELARQCDNERIDSSTGDVNPDWSPSPTTVDAAIRLKTDLQDARTRRYRGCPHSTSPSSSLNNNFDAVSGGMDSEEMVATNTAFHWAGLIHLDRRVLRKPGDDAEVQLAVREIIDALGKVSKGGTAEACLLFPMFTAGCDAREEAQRTEVLDRIRTVERSGMTQVRNARTLMEKVWETGRPWETLVQGEFFG